jgi:cell division FtsZ-interacting protein ZapD
LGVVPSSKDGLLMTRIQQQLHNELKKQQRALISMMAEPGIPRKTRENLRALIQRTDKALALVERVAGRPGVLKWIRNTITAIVMYMITRKDE